ncbi:UDP-N-acetylmuramoyl-tripeptide--D-alanyl-D-alanine ligase [Limnohabitans sp. Jir72]|uniref:UDP-N-acetylmuramoyl-tripeptide--D-alanyl-D- alanine ligase n=1 Tax=Limnohabitans sp. Jir72 TaxID=1977909 RepID=UPI000D36CF6D|nr:UDP-N-acetylmuramoyl-tripeptide--D-alanyl-D-alanine ligase [Limnohabitans sp. Jir72]PUE29952.1 UDP-N-acetylmuramoylalanyl-D-glutamyl-2, 6-diaminopimelate--D-alanyl-D-alanine ligase [Limnohabitans sp. Jir72]
MLTLKQALAWLTNAHCAGDPDLRVDRVHTDTRSVRAGDLFVALRGEKFDGNQFIAQAKIQGAVAVLCEPQGESLAQAHGLSALVVPDARLALGELAAGWRAQFDLPLIAVTGSNGKTTVTQMIASILRAHAPEHSLSTQGNLNNDIGVPLTLLNLRQHHQMAVVELGMNHPGEIAYLARLTKPTVALVNNAQREHQEYMGTVEAVARENGAVLQALADEGVAVYPADDLYTPIWTDLAALRTCRTFALQGADVSATDLLWISGAWQFTLKTKEGIAPVRLHIAGRHNVKNALAGAACALTAGVELASVVQGLQVFQPVKGRSRALTLELDGQERSLVDDTYNANPDSVRAAIDVLAELPVPRLMVLGDMGEVGNQGPQFHAEVGAYAFERGIEALYTLGAMCVDAAKAYGAARHFENMPALLEAVLSDARNFQSIVVKGSRFMKMEQVVEALVQQAAETNNKKGEAHAA